MIELFGMQLGTVFQGGTMAAVEAAKVAVEEVKQVEENGGISP